MTSSWPEPAGLRPLTALEHTTLRVFVAGHLAAVQNDHSRGVLLWRAAYYAWKAAEVRQPGGMHHNRFAYSPEALAEHAQTASNLKNNEVAALMGSGPPASSHADGMQAANLAHHEDAVRDTADQLFEGFHQALANGNRVAMQFNHFDTEANAHKSNIYYNMTLSSQSFVFDATHRHLAGNVIARATAG